MSDVTYGDLFDSISALRRLATQDFSGRVALRIHALAREVEGHLQAFSEVHEKILAKHGEEIDQGRFEIPAGNAAAFNSDMAEVRDEAVPINIPEITFEDIENCTLSPEQMGALARILSLEA